MNTGLSKTLSYYLRHVPEEGDLEMDPQGFVSLDQLLELLRREKGRDLDRQVFIDQLDDPEVERFERRGEAVRATYGHSVEVDLEYPEVDPDSPLYHGTSPRAWKSIREEGLKPMNRQYVHLSRSIEEARRVGHRHASDPVILSVKPEPQHSLTFYRAGPVVLTERVPPPDLELFEEDE